MGRSKCSCFRILSRTDGDTAADELLPQECQASSYKCPWSFRRRLPSHRVLRKNAVLEPQSVVYSKISLEAVTSSSSTAEYSYNSEQASVQSRPSKEELYVGQTLSSAAVDTEVSSVVTGNAINNNENFMESAVIVIQAAIRRHLCIRKLTKVKNVIKLQAAVRGHLVRLQAVETLRCILAISKIQAIVRNHLASRSQQKLAGVEGKGYHGEERFYSTKKLLANRFAQQLLVSTPNTRIIHIKCEPLKLDSTWIWLERWMTIITAGNGEKKEQNLTYADNESVNIFKLVSKEEKKNGSADSKIEPRALSFENKEVLNSSSKANLQSKSDDRVSYSCSNSIEKDDQNQKTNDCSFKTDPKGTSVGGTTESEHVGPLEIEGQKVAMWSRRPRNPAFSAAQSKFKELSAISRNVKCISSFSSSNEDFAADARIGIKHSQVKKGNESGFTENLPSHDSIIQIASSECGTEISISSTLDSPDRSELECGEIILEIGSMDNHNYSANACSNSVFSHANKCNESQKSQTSKLDEAAIYTSLSSNFPDLSPQIALQAQGQQETSNFQQDKSSIEGTPRSQTAVLGPYGTPSSELSVNTGNRYGDGNMTTESDRQLISRGMRRSVAKASAENLSNESKNEKRRRSTVSRIDLDDEPRMSNSNSNSLPSYMQATKSAKAKVHASISPKSSPDLHDKDDLTKKRHSLPIVNGKQDSSPPKKRTTSRVQQNPKNSDMHSLHTSSERRWQR